MVLTTNIFHFSEDQYISLVWPVSGTPVKFNRQLNQPFNWRLAKMRFWKHG